LARGAAVALRSEIEIFASLHGCETRKERSAWLDGKRLLQR